MHDPGTCIVSLEADCNVVCGISPSVNYVASDGVNVVVFCAPSTPHYGKCMPVKVNGMLKYEMYS